MIKITIYDLKQKTTLLEYGFKKVLPIEVNKMGKKLKAEESINIKDGEHKGEITKIEFVEQPYEYTQIFIKEEDTELELKLGVPTKVTVNTALGKLLENFGVKIEVGKEYDIEETIKGKVTFVTITEKTEKGTFANIVSESLKPLTN